MKRGRGRVTVVGALNMDLVVGVPELPRRGQTVLGGNLQRLPGGKGANQAVAARRAGAEVRMVGAIGDDADGRTLVATLRAEGIDVSDVSLSDAPTGAALICVDPNGENQIAVAAGANGALLPVSDAVVGADVVLVSLEVPMTTVVAMARGGHAAGAQIVINPAPAQPLPPALLELSPVLVPNEHELAALAGVHELAGAAAAVRRAGAGPVVVTRGSRGCALFDGTRHDIAAAPSQAVDTTGAGDTFCGVLAAWLADGASLRDAARAANVAAALSIRRIGAQSAMPTRAEILAALADATGPARGS